MGRMIKFISCLWIFAAPVFTPNPSFGASEACRKKIRKTSQSVLSDFMARSGALPHLSAKEESIFFERLLQLETKIVARAEKQKLVSDIDLSSRSKTISTVILPLLGQLKNGSSLSDELELEIDLKLWDEMRDEFLRRNLGLIAQVARKIYFPSIPFDYQLSEYLISLNRAFYGFEPKYSFKFSTYAFQTLKRNIFRSFDQWRGPSFASRPTEAMARQLKDLNREKQRLEGRHFTREEVATHFKVKEATAETIMLLEARPKNIELDAESQIGDGRRNGDFIGLPSVNQGRDIEQSARLARLVESTWQHINDESMRKILFAFARGVEFKKVGQELEMDRRQVSHILQQGLVTTRAVLGILSGRIKDETEQLIIKKYFGIFGETKRTTYEISRELKMTAQGVNVVIEKFLDEINEDDLNAIIEN